MATALVVSNRLPWPLDDGSRVRMFHLLRGIAAEFRTTLLTLNDPNESPDLEAFRKALVADLDLKIIPLNSRHGLRSLSLGLATSTPLHVWSYRQADLNRSIGEYIRVSGPPSVAISLTPFLADLLPTSAGRTTTVVDAQNLYGELLTEYAKQSRGLRSWYYRLTAKKTTRWERNWYGQIDRVWCCSATEQQTVNGWAQGRPARLVPNGVSLSEVASADRELAIFFGRLDYLPNVDALNYLREAILPVLAEVAPEAKLTVIGRGANAELENSLAVHPQIDYVGPVDAMGPWLAKAKFCVVPLRIGGGTRLKILEAMGAGVPVLSTSKGAEGLELEAGTHILIADGVREFVAQWLQLERDEALRVRLARSAEHQVRLRYEWSNIVKGALADLPRKGKEQ